MIPWNEVLSVAQAIYNQVEQARENKSQLNLLSRRINELLNSIPTPAQSSENVQYLKQALDTALEFATKVADKNRFIQFIKAGSYQGELVTLNQQLSYAAQQLQVSLTFNIHEFLGEFQKDMLDLVETTRRIEGLEEHEIRMLDIMQQDILTIQQGVIEMLRAVQNTPNNGQFPTRETIIVANGAVVDNLTDINEEDDWSLEVPAGMPASEILVLQQAMRAQKEHDRQIARSTPQFNEKKTVVEKGGHVGKLKHVDHSNNNSLKVVGALEQMWTRLAGGTQRQVLGELQQAAQVNPSAAVSSAQPVAPAPSQQQGWNQPQQSQQHLYGDGYTGIYQAGGAQQQQQQPPQQQQTLHRAGW